MTRKLLTLAALAVTLSAQSFDGNGALEAFYVPPAHHSIFKSKKFWIGVGVAAGSGVLAGYLATRSPAHSFGPAAPVQQPGMVEPTVDVFHIGIGGPGIPVTVAPVGGKK